MNRIHAVVDAVTSDLDCGVEHLRDLSRLTIGLGTRHQTVEIRVVGDECELTSVVLSTADVTSSDKGWRALARLAWQRNADTDVVTFTFDDRDRLVGRVRHPAATLDPEELLLYVRSLVRECDRFEYLLSGRNQF